MAEKTVKKPAKNAEVVKTVDELKAEVVKIGRAHV